MHYRARDADPQMGLRSDQVWGGRNKLNNLVEFFCTFKLMYFVLLVPLGKPLTVSLKKTEKQIPSQSLVDE